MHDHISQIHTSYVEAELALKQPIFNAIDIARNTIYAEIAGLHALANTINDTFLAVINILLKTKGRVVLSGMGKSGHIARKITATMASTGTPAIFIHPAEAGHGDLGMIAKEDVVLLFSNSGESSELNTIICYCKRFNIKIIGITRNSGSTLAKSSYVKVLLPAVREAIDIEVPTTSTTMMLAFGDALAIALSQIRGFTSDDFRIFHPLGNIAARLLQIRDVMHIGDSIPLVYLSDTVINMILIMTSKRMGCTGVLDDNGHLIGIVTDGDLRRHIHLNINNARVADFMTTNPVTIAPDALASQALQIMNTKSITNVFIVIDNKPIGIINMHDLLNTGMA